GRRLLGRRLLERRLLGRDLAGGLFPRRLLGRDRAGGPLRRLVGGPAGSGARGRLLGRGSAPSALLRRPPATRRLGFGLLDDDVDDRDDDRRRRRRWGRGRWRRHATTAAPLLDVAELGCQPVAGREVLGARVELPLGQLLPAAGGVAEAHDPEVVLHLE